MKSLQSEIQGALSHATGHLTQGVRDAARQAGWPASVAKTLQVGSDNTINLNNDAVDWEYGTINRPPAPVVRTFNNHPQTATAAALDELAKVIQKRGIV